MMSRPLLADLCKEMKVQSISLRRSDAARDGSLSLLCVSFSATDQIGQKMLAVTMEDILKILKSFKKRKK